MPRNNGQVITQEVRQQWSGPLPPPAVLREFDDLVENGAERIFSQFETEGSHRRGLEQFVVRRDARDKRLSQVLAGSFAFAALAVAAYALSQGAHAAAAVIGGATIAMVVAAMLGQKYLGKDTD